jgi:hypothetical protein
VASLRAGLERARREGRLTESGGKKKRPKYGNVKTNGFDSKKEFARWQQLQNMLAAGAIYELDRQVKYRIEVNGVHVCDFIADFRYKRTVDGREVVEDVKSAITRKNRAYRIKYKLMRAVFGIDIQEI